MPECLSKRLDVLVVGAGPAGLAAANAAGRSGAKTAILDDNPEPGGQIWRGEASHGGNSEAAKWIAKAQEAEFLAGATVISHDVKCHRVFAETKDALIEIEFSKLILASGARERVLPFPGWTLPNVMAAGGLQAMVKSGLPIAGKRVLIAGTGPLLIAVAAYLSKHGAHVLAICEQASWTALSRFAVSLFSSPGKIRQALLLRSQVRGIPFWPNSWPLKAYGSNKLETVVISRNGKRQEFRCDYLACGFHLVPNTEFAALIGCDLENGFVKVDDQQRTSVSDVFCAGEPTGIGGLEVSLIEGQIAGLVAAGKSQEILTLQQERRKADGFIRSLENVFKLRPELKKLPEDSTIVCRCEDVTCARARRHLSWRDAKNQSRCGMGPCQGRICGPATQFLFDWRPESIRPPIFPARVESLATISNSSGD